MTRPVHSKIDDSPREVTVEEVRSEVAQVMAETLTQAALLAGAKDNITVMVLLLPGAGL